MLASSSTSENYVLQKLEGTDSSSEEILLLSQLESLWIQACDRLVKIPKLPASLKRMFIYACKSLVALPDEVDGFTSLEHLTILWCQGITKFPQGLLQRLPALKYLEIENCPDLQRRCRQGGEYFDLVSSIRDRDIPATPPIVKTFVTKAIHKKRALKKFLTSC
ncbi:hypothetical protein PR202_gb02480 [Eleusine coracana subsp. coracana]|uniref:Disease resistance protein n=1 Tax=Eleusine coracana subsp. coracana TaxID=191504 RepID=A0AAV5DZH6_ELECO|nr:hypothetical protein PR202_gb02480 [Eleusine coracana subsp. coracana]